MENNEDEDFAGNYFKPKRATELLIRAQQDVARANSKHNLFHLVFFFHEFLICDKLVFTNTFYMFYISAS